MTEHNEKITKNTLVPLGLVVTILSLSYFLFNNIMDYSNRMVIMETEISNSKSTDAVHTKRLIQLSNSINQLDQTLIRQAEVMKSIEKSLSKIERKIP